MPRKFSEERARKEMSVPPFVGGIDPQLKKAGWYLRDHAEEQAKMKIEIPACPDALCGVDGYDAEPWNGATDYYLYRENGEVLVLSFVEGLAVVEAKKTAIDVLVETPSRNR